MKVISMINRQFYINKIMPYADTSCVKVLTVFIQS